MFGRRQRVSEQGNIEGGGGGGVIPGIFNGLNLRFSPLGSSQQTPATEQAEPSASGAVCSLGASHTIRPSRASSIVSTRTGITIETLQDDAQSARSIDLTLSGRRFHINRDASRISVSDQGELPPYSPPAPAYSQQMGSMDKVIADDPVSPMSPGITPEGLSTPTMNISPIGTPSPGSGAQTPRGGADLSSEANTLPDATVWRSPSFTPGPDRITVIPKRRSASQGNIPDSVNPRRRLGDANPRLLRRNGVRLPKLYTSGLSNGSETNLAGGRSLSVDTTTTETLTVHSAGASFGPHEFRRPHSPSYFGRNATGVFPSLKPSVPSSSEENRALTQLPSQSLPSLAIPESPAHIDEGDVRTHAPPAMDSENDISIHYSRLIRSIDRDHRIALHSRDRELEAMRERLNEVDQVYRKVLRDRDFVIDDLQKRVANLEAEMQSRIDKAQNEIEDQWEMRWKHRDRQLMERMRRIEIESQKQIERTVAQRDEEWVAELQKQNRELLAKLGVEEFKSPPEGY